MERLQYNYMKQRLRGHNMRVLFSFFILISVALAHGGTYQGPVGGGTPGYNGPIGGGTIGPQPGGATPPSHGGTTPPAQGGGATPAPTPTPRFGPTGPAGVGGRGFGTGGRTGRSKAKSQDQDGDWSWWWDMNDDAFYGLRTKTLGSSDTDNKDTFLGGGGDLNGSRNVTLRHIITIILPALNKGLSDPYYDAKAAAAIALGKSGGDIESVSKLVTLLNDSDHRVREAACIGLGLLGSEDATSSLKKLVSKPDEPSRLKFFASLSIGQIEGKNKKSTSAEYLIGVATIKQPNVDYNLGAIVGMSFLNDLKTEECLVSILKDESLDQIIRGYAALSLGRRGEARSAEVLSAYCADNSKTVATSCVIALGRTAKKDNAEVINKLCRMSKSAPDRAVRNFSIMALGRIGGGKATAQLAEHVIGGQYDDVTFGSLAIAIASKGGTESDLVSRLLLKKYSDSKDAKVKSAIALSFGILGDRSAIKALVKDLKDETESIELKGYICLSMGMLGYTDSVPDIYPLLSQKGDIEVRGRAAISLGLLRDHQAIEILGSLIKDSKSNKQSLASYTISLGYIGDVRAVAPLIGMAENTNDDPQRAFSYVALGLLGDKSIISEIALIQENANYLTQTQATAELLTIL